MPIAEPIAQVDVRDWARMGRMGTAAMMKKEVANLRYLWDEEVPTPLRRTPAPAWDPESISMTSRQHAFDSQELMVVRDTKPNGLFYHEDPDCVPKPHDCLLKTDPDTGLVMQQDYEPGSPQAANEQELLANKWKYDDNGVLLNPEGKAVYGDHDLQGVYKVDENGNYVKRVNTNDENWQNNLNEQTGPPPMTQHGANDNWIDDDGNRRNPGADEGFTVIEPDGTVTRLGSTAELGSILRGTWNTVAVSALPGTPSHDIGYDAGSLSSFWPGKVNARTRPKR